MKKIYDIKGMTCSMCKNTIEKSFDRIEGYFASVNLLENKLVIEAEEISDELIIKLINSLGYEVVFEQNKKKKNLNFLISIILVVILMYFSMGHMFNAYMFNLNHFQQGLVQLVLTILIFYFQRNYLSSGFKALKSLKPNMESLVFLSVSSSFVYSLYVLYKLSQNFHNYHLYFETGAMILVIVAIGKYLENINKLEATSAISKLLNLKAVKANLMIDKDKTEVVAISSLKPGDMILIKAGETVPIDCEIIKGQAEIDESLISGETIPVFKQEKDQLIGGTINLNGFLIARVTVKDSDTVLSGIINTCQEVTMKKLPIEKFVDTISSIFVPMIIFISIAVFIAWFLISKDFEVAFNYALSTLTISCPCALGLATPSAIVVATGMLSKEGILLKDSNILEKAHRIKVLLVDKTGTLTENKMEVVNYNFIDSKDSVIVAAIEKNSNHPIAKSVYEYFKAEDFEFDQVIEHTGMGIEALKNQDHYLLGNKKILDKFNINYDKKIVEEALSNAYTSLFFVKNNKIRGNIYLSDIIKKSSYSAVKQLQQKGVEVVMCTGDNKKVAVKVAEKLGINKYYSEVSPEDKYLLTKEYKKQYLTAMVGDGINDAIALTEADISFALSSGSDISYSSSNVLLLKNDLTDISYFIDISKITIKIIKQNLFWSLFYNSLLIPMAAGLFSAYGIHLDPMIAAVMMSISSIVVLTNALRIKRIKKERKETVMELKVVGMTCSHCEAAVERIFKKHGIDAKASKQHSNVVFESSNDIDLIIKEIEEFGYKVEK